MNALTPDRSDLISRLHADLSRRWHDGERPRVEGYLLDHPELGDSPDLFLHLIYAEVLLREQHGDTPALEEYVARFPRHADAIVRQWRLHRVIRSGAMASVAPEVTEPLARRVGDEGPTPVPESFPGLVLLGELGQGGMGVVYLARQVGLGDRLVAVKTVRASLADWPQALARFRTEARAVARLRHPGVVQVHAFGEHGGQLYLVMEHLAGGSLAARLRQGPLPPREAAALVARLARAVQAAHDARVIHRDLKPSNVLLTEDGEPKVSDFGLAKLLDSDAEQTRAGAMMGTPAYMAPEQAGGEGVGPAADVWAIGVILYQCLAGRLPFAGETGADVLEAARTKEPAAPEPAGLAAVCAGCLRKRPEERYATAGAVAEDLERWLAGGAVRPPGRRWSRRAVGIAAGLVLAAGVAAGALAWAQRPGGGDEKRLEPVAEPAKPTPRQEAEERLRQGRAYELKGDEVMPGPIRLMLGGAGTPVASPTEGCFSAETTGTALLEVLVPPCDRYLFSAQVRHDAAMESSAVGLYFAYRAIPAGGGKRQGGFISFNFDDRSAQARKLNKQGRPASRVGLNNHLFEDAPGATPLVSRGAGGGGHKQFEPALKLGAGPWRTLLLRVTPAEATLSWDKDGQGATHLDTQRTAVLERLLKDSTAAFPSFPGWRAVPTAVVPRAGLGLYVNRGKASFRQVVVTPLKRDE